ncbi:kinase-associated protein B [Virgibacillus natechei]|uniref:Kinase-associated protein B n=1 Tax=Virgibacillus natechei TaxID=1216297 RepID=A0ABS4IF18_9BACI|nr:sporulation phosphorelay system protein KapB [Virgibacillus natechei]MBP1969539.1 kinase-associated protein B [Virgibacillus natechei]UZD11760.1 kinase-associated lipoprotein B [Virgibacillus natechei]
MADITIGTIVRAHYNSGTYIGEVKEDRGEHYLIEVLAVKKHPMQGDLHNPGEVEDVFFHERKALAPHEKMNVKKPAAKPFDEGVPTYGKSLKQAVESYKEKLTTEETAFNKKALQTLIELEEKHYEKNYY